MGPGMSTTELPLLEPGVMSVPHPSSYPNHQTHMVVDTVPIKQVPAVLRCQQKEDVS